MAKVLFAFLALITIQYAFTASISFRWCFKSTAEMKKCAEFVKYVNATAQNLTLDVSASCVNGSTSDGCVAKIKNDEADLVTLDGGRVYYAGKDSNLVPIVSEKYGQYGVKYYAVAVVKKANKGFDLKSLKGKKSCHTGARRTAGWNVPIGYLLRTKIMPAVACGNEDNDFTSASKFFNESCVPGVNATEYSNLCALCNGTGNDKCSTELAKNAYVGYHGAFKCMGDGKGDVAFVKFTTTQEVVGGGGYGNVGDYEYLCKDGGRKATTEYKNCNLGFNPAHAVVTRKDNTGINGIIRILERMSDLYGTNQKDSNKFQLFNSTGYGGSNLIFKDSTSELVGLKKDQQTYTGFLGDDYVKDLEALKTCAGIKPTTGSTSAPAPARTPTSVATISGPITELVLLIALFSILFL